VLHKAISTNFRISHFPYPGLRINDAGDLVDDRTGEVINAMGVTRFDLATKAIRGDFDAGIPPEQVRAYRASETWNISI